jgi:hypothetical protein
MGESEWRVWDRWLESKQGCDRAWVRVREQETTRVSAWSSWGCRASKRALRTGEH